MSAGSRITEDVIIAAHRQGFVRLQTASIARAAGLSETAVRSWAQGGHVSATSDAAIRGALGIPLERSSVGEAAQ